MSDKAKEGTSGPSTGPEKGEKRARGRPRKPKSDEVVVTLNFSFPVLFCSVLCWRRVALTVGQNVV